MESWAFALDAKGLQTVVAGGAFARRTCKLCDDGIVVEGEYRISKVCRRPPCTCAESIQSVDTHFLPSVLYDSFTIPSPVPCLH